MNTEILVSTVAYTHMGIELVFSGILTIAMHYGVAANPFLASAVYAGSATGVYQYPVWGGVFAILVGIVGIVVGSGIQKTIKSIKGVSFVGFIGFITQFIAFCFSCNSIATSVAFIRLGSGSPAFNVSPLIFSIIYFIVFLINFAICIRFMYMGRVIIKSTTVIVQPTSTTVVIQQSTIQTPQQPPPGYNVTYNQPVQPMQPVQPGYVA